MSTTSTTSGSRPRAAAGRAQQARPDHDSDATPDLGDRRTDLGKTAGVVVMAVLMGLTSWVVASVSTWLVPVYVTAMVLIFVVPRAHHPAGRERAGGGTRQGDRTDHAHGASGPAGAGSNPGDPASLETRGSSEVSASEPGPPGSVTKPRRVRGRGRKPSRPSAEPAVAPAATWIQVAPGKFVRADSRDQGPTAASEPEALAEADKAPIGEDGSPSEPLEEAVSTTDSTLVDAPAEADPIEPGPSPELAVPFVEPVTVAEPQPVSPLDGLEQNASWAAGEYGIAPSAFGSGLREAPLEETCREQDQPGSSAPPRHPAETLDEAGVEPMPPVTRESSCTGNARGASPAVPRRGCPSVWTGSDGDRQTRGARRELHRLGPAKTGLPPPWCSGCLPAFPHVKVLARRPFSSGVLEFRRARGRGDSSLSDPGAAELRPSSPDAPPLPTPLAAVAPLSDPSA